MCLFLVFIRVFEIIFLIIFFCVIVICLFVLFREMILISFLFEKIGDVLSIGSVIDLMFLVNDIVILWGILFDFLRFLDRDLCMCLFVFFIRMWISVWVIFNFWGFSVLVLICVLMVMVNLVFVFILGLIRSFLMLLVESWFCKFIVFNFFKYVRMF